MVQFIGLAALARRLLSVSALSGWCFRDAFPASGLEFNVIRAQRFGVVCVVCVLELRGTGRWEIGAAKVQLDQRRHLPVLLKVVRVYRLSYAN